MKMFAQYKTKKFALFAVSLIFVLVFNFSHLTNAAACDEEHPDIFEVTLIDAFYADLDGDGIEDDSWVSGKVELQENYFDKIDDDDLWHYYLKLEIITPSGVEFKYYFSVYSETNKQEFLIYTYNTASEPGWYTVNLWGFTVIDDDDHFHSFDSMIFDPPSASGPGDPAPAYIFLI